MGTHTIWSGASWQRATFTRHTKQRALWRYNQRALAQLIKAAAHCSLLYKQGTGEVGGGAAKANQHAARSLTSATRTSQSSRLLIPVGLPLIPIWKRIGETLNNNQLRVTSGFDAQQVITVKTMTDLTSGFTRNVTNTPRARARHPIIRKRFCCFVIKRTERQAGNSWRFRSAWGRNQSRPPTVGTSPGRRPMEARTAEAATILQLSEANIETLNAVFSGFLGKAVRWY